MTQWGLDTLFNPAKRHMDEEKRRLQSTREEIGDASGGRRIDLDSGKVRIARPSAKAAAAETDSDETDSDDAATEAATATVDASDGVAPVEATAAADETETNAETETDTA